MTGATTVTEVPSGLLGSCWVFLGRNQVYTSFRTPHTHTHAAAAMSQDCPFSCLKRRRRELVETAQKRRVWELEAIALAEAALAGDPAAHSEL